MNKRQREIVGNRLASEEQILKELKEIYEEARKRDLQEIKNGNRNFEGIGKPEDL